MGPILTPGDLLGEDHVAGHDGLLHGAGGDFVGLEDEGAQPPGEQHHENHEHEHGAYYGLTIDYPYTVPEGGLWVMGDNRTNSQDSRYFGAIKESSVFVPAPTSLS